MLAQNQDGRWQFDIKDRYIKENTRFFYRIPCRPDVCGRNVFRYVSSEEDECHLGLQFTNRRTRRWYTHTRTLHLRFCIIIIRILPVNGAARVSACSHSVSAEKKKEKKSILNGTTLTVRFLCKFSNRVLYVRAKCVCVYNMSYACVIVERRRKRP